MAKPKQPKTYREIRLAREENQTEFWGRFGCTQSAGSRYETDRACPRSLAILVELFLSGAVTDAELHKAARAAQKAGR
jgi:hypothetical protein